MIDIIDAPLQRGVQPGVQRAALISRIRIHQRPTVGAAGAPLSILHCILLPLFAFAR